MLRFVIGMRLIERKDWKICIEEINEVLGSVSG